MSGELIRIEKDGFPVNPLEVVARDTALHAGTSPTMKKRIPLDYGIIFGFHVEILICEGDVVPCEISLPGEPRAEGHLEDALTIGLFRREVGMDGESFTHMGDYQFVATIIRPMACRFCSPN